MNIETKANIGDTIFFLKKINRKTCSVCAGTGKICIGTAINPNFDSPDKFAKFIGEQLEQNLNQILTGDVREYTCPECNGKGTVKVTGWPKVEINPDMCRYLSDKPYTTETGVDFLVFADADENKNVYTRIIMNPPFAKHQDVDHILAAYNLLSSGGVLVSVVSPSPFFRTDKKSVVFQNWIREVDAEVIDVPEGAFKESGTMIRTKIIKAYK